MKSYFLIIGANSILTLLGIVVFIYLYNPSHHTRVEEPTIETNHLRLAQLRVDFPILTIHDPQAKLLSFYYPQSRNFADEGVGVGFLYQIQGHKIVLSEVYRDLDPLSHEFSGYQGKNIQGKMIKVKSENQPLQSNFAWFEDVGVYRLEADIPEDTMLSIFEKIGNFTSEDERLISEVKNIYIGKRF